MGRTTQAHRQFANELVRLCAGTENSGTYAFKRGFHSSRADNQKNWPGNYSYRDLPNQWGPSDASAGTDWTFRDAQGGSYATISRYGGRLLTARDDPRCRGWYEFYGNADLDRQVEGWCYYCGESATSDSTHLWHIHFSELRMWAESWLNKDAMLSVLRGELLTTFYDRWNWPAWSAIGEPMRNGARGIAVWFVQRAIGISADGIYGAATEASVRALQRARGLSVDGCVGPATWDVLSSAAPKVNPQEPTNEGGTMVQVTGPDPFDRESPIDRQAAYLRDILFGVATGYVPSYAQNGAENGLAARLERIEYFLRTGVSIPVTVQLDAEALKSVVSAVKQALREGTD